METHDIRAGVEAAPTEEPRAPEGTMSKLRLDLEDLSVETFDPDPGRAERGTVAGHADGTAATVCWGQCGGGETGYAFCTYGRESCGGTCDTNCITCASCDGSCPQVGCPTGYSCDGTTCVNTCWASCNQTCGCTQEATCPCL